MHFKIKWWQLIPYEIAVLSFGIIIGSYWHYFFVDFLYLFLLLLLICGGYVIYVFAGQIDASKND